MMLKPEHSPQDTENDSASSVILFNDDVNSFDWVITALVEICEHDPLQAEQCAWLVHLGGKCEVKTGPLDQLVKYKNALLKRGLSVEIND